MANIVTAIALLTVVIFKKKILTLNIPYIDVSPWSTPSQSNIVYLEVLAKCATPVLLAVNEI